MRASSGSLVAIVSVLVASVAVAAKPVMRVNGVEVTDAQIDLAKKVVVMQVPKGQQGSEDVILRHAVDQTLFRVLFVQLAQAANVKVDTKAIDEAIEKQKAAMGGEVKFKEGLAAAGVSEPEIRQLEFERALMEGYVQAHVAPTAAATDAEVKAYYDSRPQEFQRPESVKVRAIAVGLPPGADATAKAAARAKIDGALKRVKGGEDFAKVASEVSEGQTKSAGGDMGYVPKGKLTPEVESAVFALKNGETTGVMENPTAFFIFKVEDRKEPGLVPLDEAKESLKGYLKNQKIGLAIRLKVNELKAKATIEYLDPALKAAATAAPPAAPAAPAAEAKPAAPPAPPAKSH